MKLWSPLLLIAGTVWVFGDHLFSGGMLLSLPLLTLAVFQLSLAQMELRNNVVRYRRLVKWHTISRSELAASGVVWPGFIGYVRFRRYFPPFGLLYFVLDANSDDNPFRLGSYPLLRYLGGETPHVQSTPEEFSRPESRNRASKLFGVAAVGALVTFMRIYLSGPVFQKTQIQPRFLGIVAQLFRTFDNPTVALIVVFILSVLAIRTHDSRRALFFAFIGGLFVPLVWNGQ
jgi:hypothetical protein